MIFHENHQLADDSHVICRKLGNMSQNLSSAAVVIGALRVNYLWLKILNKNNSITIYIFQNFQPPLGRKFEKE